jgi:hypothetical protein
LNRGVGIIAYFLTIGIGGIDSSLGRFDCIVGSAFLGFSG